MPFLGTCGPQICAKDQKVYLLKFKPDHLVRLKTFSLPPLEASAAVTKAELAAAAAEAAEAAAAAAAVL